MKYIIKHEGLLFMCVAGIISLVLVITCFILFRSKEALFTIAVLWNIVIWPLYLLNRATGLSIIIDDKTIRIKGMFYRKTIRIEDIYDISIENYTRRMQSGITVINYHRMRMKISVVPGKTIVLDDDATLNLETGWKFEPKTDKKPDEEVALYQIYMHLKPMIWKGTVSNEE